MCALDFVVGLHCQQKKNKYVLNNKFYKSLKLLRTIKHDLIRNKFKLKTNFLLSHSKTQEFLRNLNYFYIESNLRK